MFGYDVVTSCKEMHRIPEQSIPISITRNCAICGNRVAICRMGGRSRRSNLPTEEVHGAVEEERLDLASRIEAKTSAWSVEALADLLEVSPKTLYKMARSGRIPVIRIGGVLRFDSVLTANWLRARSNDTVLQRKEHHTVTGGPLGLPDERQPPHNAIYMAVGMKLIRGPALSPETQREPFGTVQSAILCVLR